MAHAESGFVLDPIAPPQVPPELRGRRVILRSRGLSDVDDRLAFPIVPEDEDMFGGLWRREWRGEMRHTHERLEALAATPTRPAASRPVWRRRGAHSLEEVKRRTKVIGRFPGETSCLSLRWTVLDLFIDSARGFALTHWSTASWRRCAQPA